MLKYKFVRPLFYVSLLLALAGIWLLAWPGWIVFPIVFLYLSVTAWGAYFIQSGYFLDARCSGSTGEMKIAISFDDGPCPEVTPGVLDLLREYQVTATFFCIGRRIPGNEGLLTRICEEGHRVGNHSWSHSYFFDIYSDWKVEDEIRTTNEAIRKITGQEVGFFRPPFGVTNPAIARVVKKLGIPVIGWSIRSYDTTIKNQDVLFERVTRRLKGGDIVLFHDTLPRIIPVLKRFLEFAKREGYAIVPLENLNPVL